MRRISITLVLAFEFSRFAMEYPRTNVENAKFYTSKQDFAFAQARINVPKSFHLQLSQATFVKLIPLAFPVNLNHSILLTHFFQEESKVLYFL